METEVKRIKGDMAPPKMATGLGTGGWGARAVNLRPGGVTWGLGGVPASK